MCPAQREDLIYTVSSPRLDVSAMSMRPLRLRLSPSLLDDPKTSVDESNPREDPAGLPPGSTTTERLAQDGPRRLGSMPASVRLISSDSRV